MIMLEPPPQYDHPYHGQVIEQRLSKLQLILMCHGFSAACSWVSKGVCHIALPSSEKDGRTLAMMRQHEIGHCNGWPGHHPNGRWVDETGKSVALSKNRRSHWLPF